MRLHSFFSLRRRAGRLSCGSGRSRRRSGVELLEDRKLLSVLTVTDTGDSGSDTGSLRFALLNAQNGDTIDFDIPTTDPGYVPATGSWTIKPASPLPAITNSIFIDGFSQPGYSGTPVIKLSGSNAGTASGLTITGSGVTVRGLDITRFSQSAAILISGTGATGDWVYGNFLGIDPTGTQVDYDYAGVEIAGGAVGNLIGTNGDGVNDAAERNVISGNLYAGVWITDAGTEQNVVAGNYIGTNATGTAAVANGDYGVLLAAATTDNWVGVNPVSGSPNADQANVISGNTDYGVYVTASNANVLAGNLIGTDASGSTAIPNDDGVVVDEGSSFNLVGTSGQDGAVDDALERNVISGNSVGGVLVIHASLGNVIAGNDIGTTAGGTTALANSYWGAYIGAGSQDNWVGVNPVYGPETADQRNIISGNSQENVFLTGTLTTGNTVAGNYIGTDYTGTVALSNYVGVYIQNQAHGNLIGTNGDGVSDALERNIISGNEIGVWLNYAGINDVIAGNYIGTDVSGETALGNGLYGVWITSEASNEWIGVNALEGPENADEGNVISGSGGAGVDISGSGVDDNTVAGNDIGTDYTGTIAIPNYGGVEIDSGASGNTIGGTAALAGNVIASNAGDGVNIGLNATDASTGNAVLSNAIDGNTGVGIDLGDDGVTPDHSSPTTGVIAGAPNGDQNFPVLSSAVFVPDTTDPNGTLTVSGSLAADPNTTYIVQFFANPTADPSGFGQGQTLLESLSVTTDASGNASLTGTFTTANLTGEFISATATDPNGNTSEFSQDLAVINTSESSVVVPIVADPATEQSVLESAVSEIENLPVGTTAPAVDVQPTDTGGLDDVLAAINGLSSQSTPVTVALDLGGQTLQADTTLSPPTGVNVVIQNGTLMGDAPALTVAAGNVMLYNVTASNSTSSPTIVVSGGSLTVEDSTIDGSAVAGQAAISITGGTVDLGTSSLSRRQYDQHQRRR